MHISAFVDLGQLQVKINVDYYPCPWVIQVNDADLHKFNPGIIQCLHAISNCASTP